MGWQSGAKSLENVSTKERKLGDVAKDPASPPVFAALAESTFRYAQYNTSWWHV
jgi:hypothetical protein